MAWGNDLILDIFLKISEQDLLFDSVALGGKRKRMEDDLNF